MLSLKSLHELSLLGLKTGSICQSLCIYDVPADGITYHLRYDRPNCNKIHTENMSAKFCSGERHQFTARLSFVRLLCVSRRRLYNYHDKELGRFSARIAGTMKNG